MSFQIAESASTPTYTLLDDQFDRTRFVLKSATDKSAQLFVCKDPEILNSRFAFGGISPNLKYTISPRLFVALIASIRNAFIGISWKAACVNGASSDSIRIEVAGIPAGLSLILSMGLYTGWSDGLKTFTEFLINSAFVANLM